MSVSADDCECPEFWRENITKARIAHKCSACREEIPPGSRYKKVVFLFEGAIDTIKRCSRCEAMYQHLLKRMRAQNKDRPRWDAELPDASLDCGHTFEEVWKEPPPPDVAELAFLLPGETPGALLSAGGGS